MDETMLVDARLRSLCTLSGPTIHELRGAANVLALHLQILGMEATDDDGVARRQKSLAAADDGRRRLFDIAETFVRAAAPLDSSPRAFDLARVAADVVAVARPYAAHRRVHLTVAAGASIAPALGRRDVVAQVLLDVMLALLDGLPTGGTLEVAVEAGVEHAATTLRPAEGGAAFDPALLARAESGIQWAGGTLRADGRIVVRMPVPPPGDSDES
jgi:signal transduction histidine kinase